MVLHQLHCIIYHDYIIQHLRFMGHGAGFEWSEQKHQELTIYHRETYPSSQVVLNHKAAHQQIESKDTILERIFWTHATIDWQMFHLCTTFFSAICNVPSGLYIYMLRYLKMKHPQFMLSDNFKKVNCALDKLDSYNVS